MICIECTNPEITCLYSEYKSKYIQLTICPKCGKMADKYIEFDKVILFLDVLLLKPQAYRHLAYNVVEDALFGEEKGKDIEKSHERTGTFHIYKKLMRYALLTILFEVYLKWAYEEKRNSHSLIMQQVLQAPVPLQYAFFNFQQIIERFIMCILMDFLFSCLGWGKTPNRNLGHHLQRGYYILVLLLTFFMSLAVKCLPIIMLIWPYDNAIVASEIVDILGFFNTVEALKINTSKSYFTTFTVVLVSTTVLVALRKLAVSLLAAYFSANWAPMDLLENEYALVVGQAKSLVTFLRLIFTHL